MKKYFKIFTTQLSIGVTYKAEVLSLVAVEVIQVTAILFLWNAVFSTTDNVDGLSRQQTISYYIVTLITGIFTTIALSDYIGEHIRTGFLSNLLLRPYRIGLASVIEIIAQKVAQVIFIFPLYVGLIIFLVTSGAFPGITIERVALFYFFLLLGIVAHIFMDLTMSWLAFWVENIWWFKHFKRVTFRVLGGLSFPLSLLPQNLFQIAQVLPFRYIYFVPTAYLLDIEGVNFEYDLGLACLWIGLFIIAGQILWSVGIKKYSAYGN